MKIFVQDFAGHAFPLHLSTELARRGHDVVHAYFADIPGPKGKVTANDLPNLRIEPIHVTRKFKPYSYFERSSAHREFAGLVSSRIIDFCPDVVLSGNTPTDAQFLLNRTCSRQGIRFVHWVQDFYPLALEALLIRKFGATGGRLCAFPFRLLERRIFKRSDAVVFISEDFAAYAARENYIASRSLVVENWASLEDLPVRAKDNEWARKNDLHDKFVFLYSGTMGLKHNPNTLLQLAHQFREREDVRIVLVSEGIGRQFLENAKRREGLDNLILLNFQPFAQLPEVLASAEVLLASVEPDAGTFCVPSKILSYLCAARPILLSVPPQNLAARVLTRADAGFVTDPGQTQSFVDRAMELYQDRARLAQMGRNARRYAESTFDIYQIGSIFETVLRGSGDKTAAVSEPVAIRSSS